MIISILIDTFWHIVQFAQNSYNAANQQERTTSYCPQYTSYRILIGLHEENTTLTIIMFIS